MATGRKTGGRRAGTPNKMTAAVRSNVLAVFENIGGIKNMAVWAGENPTEFYKLYGRMAAGDPDALGGPDNPLNLRAVVEFVRPK